MNANAPAPAGGGSAQSQTGDAVSVLVVYDAYECGLRAMDACRRLQNACKAQLSLDAKLWKADVLTEPLIRAVAAQEAVDAAVILFSLEGDVPLPRHVATWVEMWLPKKRAQGAAIAFVWASPLSVAGVETAFRLRRYAAMGGMDYVCDGDKTTIAPKRGLPTRTKPRAAAPMSTAALKRRPMGADFAIDL